MSKGTTYKRCSCVDPNTRKRLGQKCPKLRRGNGWNSHHGTWTLQIELPRTATGTRRPARPGGYPGQAEAEADLGKIREALAIAEPADKDALTKIGDLIQAALDGGEPIPSAEQIRAQVRLGYHTKQIPDADVWYDTWLGGRKKPKKGTLRSYEGHLRLHIKPVVCGIRIDELEVKHAQDVFDRIEERNDLIRTCRNSPDQAKRDQVKGLRIIGAATQHRIRATARAGWNAAKRRVKETGVTGENPFSHVELPVAKAPKALVWTTERVKYWEATGQIPSPVMVWTPVLTGAFLDHAEAANDRLYAIYHLIAFTGLRRGEACGLHWADVDLDNKVITIRWQISQLGWATELDTPKTDASTDNVTIDDETVQALRAHRIRQWRERAAAGDEWTETGLVFTTPTGGQLHPADVTDHFKFLTRQAGLPPVRLHDLRHGAAALALAARVPMKVVSARLRHSSITVTADIYSSVLPELAHEAAELTAAMVPRRSRASAEPSAAPTDVVVADESHSVQPGTGPWGRFGQ